MTKCIKIQRTIKKLKNQAIEWEKIFAHDILDCDSFFKFNSEERNMPMRKLAKIRKSGEKLTDHHTEEVI